MEAPGPERRLAAVLAADMVGYSRLMEVDEAGTLARLKTHRLELIDPAIAKNRGRIIKTTGDGMLVEFHSVVDAVTCAPKSSAGWRGAMPMCRRRDILFRIGINLGDVIIEENDIFGDGVNIAARLEVLAEPGGICVTGAVRDQLGHRLDDIAFEDIGEQNVKNITRPIRVFRVRLRAGCSRSAGRPARTSRSDNHDQEAVDRRAALRQYERRSGPGILRRRPHRGHHHRAVALPRPARHLAQLDLRLQGQSREGAGGRARARRPLRRRRQRAQGRQSRAHHRAADRRANRPACLGRTLRPRARRYLRHPGRGDRRDRRHASRPRRGGRRRNARSAIRTENMRAYEYVLAAKVLHHRSRREDNVEAQTLLDRAIALDPNYAHAHAWRACIAGPVLGL